MHESFASNKIGVDARLQPIEKLFVRPERDLGRMFAGNGGGHMCKRSPVSAGGKDGNGRSVGVLDRPRLPRNIYQKSSTYDTIKNCALIWTAVARHRFAEAAACCPW